MGALERFETKVVVLHKENHHSATQTCFSKRLHDHESLPGKALEAPRGGARRVGTLDRVETKVLVLHK